MKNAAVWKPSKFIVEKGRILPSPDVAELAIGSRFVAGLVAEVYQRVLPEHLRGVLLDLGCGKVPLYEVYRELVEEVVCVDWSNSYHETSHLDYELDLNAPLPLPSSSFDSILLTDVLEHIAEPEVLWAEVARLLKPDGKLVLVVPFLYWLHEGPYDYYRYTEHRLALSCEEHGLRIVSLEPYGGSPEVMMDIVAKHLAFSKALSAIHLSVARLFSRSWIGRKLTEKTCRHFPLGYCLVAEKPRVAGRGERGPSGLSTPDPAEPDHGRE